MDIPRLASQKLGKLHGIKNLRGGVEAQDDLWGLALGEQRLTEVVERRDADPAPDEDRGVPALMRVEAVAETRQGIDFYAGLPFGHALGPLAHHFVQKSQSRVIPVTDGDGAAKITAMDLEVYKLARSRQGAGVALEDQPVDRVRERGVLTDRINHLFHGITPIVWINRLR